MAHVDSILLRPLITEKASFKTETENRYGFEVALSANKNQIRQAVEKLYDVRVLNVKTTVLPGKHKRYGRYSSKTNKSKKAFVKLANGQKIEFFKGV
jgi:large subunit ribosomal protein L23